jgi:dipeptidyl aminopeptidase/acylaminoacyl peptidase
MRYFYVFIVLFTMQHSVYSQQADDSPHPVTMDDVMKMLLITAMEANPADSTVLIQVQEYDGRDKFTKDLWYVKAGGKPKKLTTFGVSGSFTFSPDGKKVAFYGERNGKTGIFILPLDGGEAQILKEVPLTADNLRWIKDRIFFSSEVFPDCGSDFMCTKKSLEEKAKVTSALVYTDLFFRQWNFWRNGAFSNLFSLDIQTGRIQNVVSGQFDVPSVPFGGKEEYSVTSDGSSVAYSAKKEKDQALQTNDDIFEIIDGKEVRITENKGSDRVPQYSPDTKYIAYLSQETPGFESGQWLLKVYNRKTGEHFTLAKELDNWIEEFVWSKDSKWLFFIVEEEGNRIVYRIKAEKDAKAKRISGYNVYRRISLSPDGKALFLTRETITQPPDVYSFDLAKLSESRITDLNHDLLAALKMPEVKEIWYDGAEIAPDTKHKIHTFLVLPPENRSGKKYPLVIMIHGGPQGAWLNGFHSRWTPLGLAGHGFVVAMPNPTGSTGYGQDFVNAISRDWGGKCYEDIMAFLDYADRIPEIDSKKVCAIGGSFGGYMVNWIEGHTDRFKCLVSHAGPSSLESKYGSTDELWFPEWDIGGTPWTNPDAYQKWSPHKYAQNFRTPLLVIHGQNDFRVPLEQALVMFTYLKRLNVESKLVVFPDEDHFISKPKNRKFWYDTVVQWLKAHLM